MTKIRLAAAATLVAATFAATPAHAFCWVYVWTQPIYYHVPNVGSVYLEGHYICVT